MLLRAQYALVLTNGSAKCPSRLRQGDGQRPYNRRRSVKLQTPPSTSASEMPPRCLNCGHDLYGPFCSQCGQEATDPVPRLGDLLRDVYDEFLKVDAKAYRTLKSLLRYPGQLTSEYAMGRRANYVAPFKLYFTTSFLFFLMMDLSGDRDLSSWGLQEVPGASPRIMAAAQAGAQFYFDNTAIISILLLPLNAVVLAGLFRGRKQPFILHLVATLHIWSGTVLLFFVPYGLLEIAIKIAPSPLLKTLMAPGYLIVFFAYQYFAFRRLFRASALESAFKSSALTTWTMATSTVACIVLVVGFILVDARNGTDKAKDGPIRHAQEQQISRSGPGRPNGPQRDRGLQQPRQ